MDKRKLHLLTTVFTCTVLKSLFISPINWIPEQGILGQNFVFWLMVIGLASHAFKKIRTVDDLLAVRPKGRESLSFEWENNARDLPVLRKVSANGADPTHALTFSSLRHHYISLAKRACFRDPLRIHGIRGGVATSLDDK